MRGPSPVVASGGHSSSRCAGPSPSRPLLLRSTGSRRAGSAIVAHGPSCSAACGILPDQGSNPRPPHRQADSQPLRHQGSPAVILNPGYTLESSGECEKSAQARPIPTAPEFGGGWGLGIPINSGLRTTRVKEISS